MAAALFKAVTSLQRKDEEEAELGWAGASVHNRRRIHADAPTVGSFQDARGRTSFSVSSQAEGEESASEIVMLPAGANK